MTTHTSTRKPLYRRIKPVGWLAIAVLTVLFVGLALLLIKPLTYPIRSLPAAGSTIDRSIVTITPYREPTLTPAPSATPLPAGWTQATDPDGKPYLVSPADTEQAVRSAFETVT